MKDHKTSSALQRIKQFSDLLLPQINSVFEFFNPPRIFDFLIFSS